MRHDPRQTELEGELLFLPPSPTSAGFRRSREIWGTLTSFSGLTDLVNEVSVPTSPLIEGVDPVKARKYLYEKRAISVRPTRPWHQAPYACGFPNPFASQVELEALVAGIEEIVKV